ncbi:phage holin family protein [Bombilactobacillus thymidiniphilus]|uniref:Phage holin family protein n=1 Tax=Bombilactobacillus thymidiniphilus TaxID=2923363 RepID=A0ABY4PCM7_9LACO|nr:phage holin family protein [Bombilactobacillus thymidiniphilus]UQS83319.1 phage holin family protein [Bombilactobacillus thymidiniphilus]
MKIIYQTLINTLLFMAIARVLPTMLWLNDWVSAVIAGFILFILNITIKPILKIISLPITLLTFGLFSIVVNALTLEIVRLIIPGFGLSSFSAAMLISVIMSIANAFVGYNAFKRT